MLLYSTVSPVDSVRISEHCLKDDDRSSTYGSLLWWGRVHWPCHETPWNSGITCGMASVLSGSLQGHL